MKIVFMGTPDFACEALKAIKNHGDDIALILTRADKPKGRGYVMTPSPVKQLAMSYGIPVLTPKTLRDGEICKTLADIKADVFIVAAYGRILPKEVLDMPEYGCINIHASLLPAWRGAAPINRAVMSGDSVGGVTIMYMDEGIDTGDIILQKKVEIDPQMNAGEYHDILARLGGEAICEYLDMLENGKVTRTKQPEIGISYAQKIEKSESLIDFSQSAKAVHDLIRGLAPAPCAYAVLHGKRVKFCKAHVGTLCGNAGSTLAFDDGGITVACNGGSIVVEILQPEGKKAMTAAEFLRGNRLNIGESWA